MVLYRAEHVGLYEVFKVMEENNMENKDIVEVMELEDDGDEIEYDAADEMETGVSSRTIARTIWAGIVLINSILLILGKTPLGLDENMIYEICSGLAAVVATAQVWWKNNSFTKKAREADLVKDGLKEAV